MTGHREGPGTPVLPEHTFARARLFQRIDQGTRGRVTTVVAPAGYGKSVLVAQWRSSVADRPVAWVDLGPADDDAVHFTRSVVAALSTVHPDLGAVADQVDVGGHSLGEDLIEQIVSNLALVPDVVVVFDNFEFLRTPQLIADVATLVERAPATTHVVIISRSDPGIGISRLRLSGDLVEVRAGDLAMSRGEAAMLLERGGVELPDPHSIDVLVARTSGWPAALQLAAVSMRTMDDPTGFIERFSGNDRHVAEYLTEEVIATCSADERRFMIETSVLGTLNGHLCDFVLERPGSHRVLRDLEHRGMLLERMDAGSDSYRYHPLLSDLLRTELERNDPSRHRQLLRRAARWYGDRDDLASSSDYLVRAAAWDELLTLSRVHGRTCFERGQTTMLRSRLEAMPEAQRIDSPAATLTLAILRLLTGGAHQADSELTRLETIHDLTPWEQTVVDVTRAAMVTWQLPPDRALDAGRRALDRMAVIAPEETPVDVLGISSPSSLEAISLVSVGRATHYMGGRDDEARSVLIEAADRSAGGYLPWHLHSLGARAILEALAGELRLAVSLASRAIELALGAGIERHPATAEPHLAIAIVRREEDALTDAGFSLREALALARSNHRAPLLDLHASELLRLSLATGGPDSIPGDVPGTLIAEASMATRPALAARMASAVASWRLAAGDYRGAEAWLRDHRHLRSNDLDIVATALALVRRDTAAAQALLDRMADDRTTRGQVSRLAQSAAVADLLGDAAGAERQMSAAVDLAEAAGLRRVFLDAGPDVIRVLRAHSDSRPSAFVRSILQRHLTRPGSRIVPALDEQLTERETAVLRYLPTRLSYAEIAAQLYVSVNTIKTHLKHIYRKLGAESRSEAIERAEAVGLL